MSIKISNNGSIDAYFCGKSAICSKKEKEKIAAFFKIFTKMLFKLSVQILRKKSFAPNLRIPKYLLIF